jgi:hypothetical protein
VANRKQRRAEQAARRRAARAAAYAAGVEARETNELPPGYLDLIYEMARLISRWIGEQPTPPELLWHDMTRGEPKTLIIGAMRGESLKYVAGSPDAVRCLEWVDEQTGHEATLYQATWALKLAGQLPGGPPPPTAQSWGSKIIEDWARERENPARKLDVPVVCPHCGKELDAAGGAGDHRPTPGALNICVYCAGLSQFTDALGLAALSDEDVARLDEETRGGLLDAQAMLRRALLRMAGAKPPGGVEA